MFAILQFKNGRDNDKKTRKVNNADTKLDILTCILLLSCRLKEIWLSVEKGSSMRPRHVNRAASQHTQCSDLNFHFLCLTALFSNHSVAYSYERLFARSLSLCIQSNKQSNNILYKV